MYIYTEFCIYILHFSYDLHYVFWSEIIFKITINYDEINLHYIFWIEIRFKKLPLTMMQLKPILWTTTRLKNNTSFMIRVEENHTLVNLKLIQKKKEKIHVNIGLDMLILNMTCNIFVCVILIWICYKLVIL